MQAAYLNAFAPDADPDIVAAVIAAWPQADNCRLGSMLRRAHFLAAIAVETNGLQEIPATGMLHEAAFLLGPDEALISALEFWTSENLKNYADADDLVSLRTAIGASGSLEDATTWLQRAKEFVI